MTHGRYIRRTNSSDAISATFSEELADITRHALEAIYSDGSPERLDAIWNVRLTYTPRGGRLTFIVDGFDMLHQLSNVNYAVNASWPHRFLHQRPPALRALLMPIPSQHSAEEVIRLESWV